MRNPGVEAVYVRHTQPNSPLFIPGHSDLDLTVVISDVAVQSPGTVEAVASFLEHRRLFYYYLSPDDARITTAGELNRMTEKWPPVEIFVGPEDWTLLAGSDVRSIGSKILPFEQTSWHPEFNRWWDHILQDYLLLSMPGLENQYHRVFYRGAIKQAAYFMLARGLNPPVHESFTDHRLTNWVLDEHPGLKSVLEGLEERGYWEGDQQNTRERIFHEVLLNAERFHTGLAGYPESLEQQQPGLPPDELHAGAYKALAAKIESLPELKSRLAGVLVYPTPYCYPYFYQADLLLPENISVVELTTLANSIRQVFRGREFESDGYHFAISLIPFRIYQSPLVFRGSPFPFLEHHVKRYARVLFGPNPLALDKVNSRELTEWCKIFLPYFTSNLNRRVEHSSRTLNFCHIAAVRLFLETGEIVTDPPVLRARHEKVFAEESPPPEVWEYLLRDKPGRDQHHLYLSATTHLKMELEKVEQQLADKENQLPFEPDEESLR